MFTDALMSCTFLLIGSGSSIFRLLNYSTINLSDNIYSHFLLASIGIGALGARSIFKIAYNFFWRQYPIDPLKIEEELSQVKNNKNILDSSLSTLGIGAVIFSLYQHHNCAISGTIIIGTLTLIEIICLKDESSNNPENNNNDNDNDEAETNLQLFTSIFGGQINSLWIITNEIFGQTVGNNYLRLANIAYFISSIQQPDPFYHGWSIKNSINDYLMLTFIILSTEALIQTSIYS